MESVEPSDQEVVDSVRRGDHRRYAVIIDRYSPRLIRYATSLLRNADDAQDVVQETFIKAYRNLWAFDLHRPFSSWIYRITHNEAINWLRQHQQLMTGEWVQTFLEQQHSKERPDDDFSQAELQQLLTTSLKKIPLIYREPLILFYLDERNYEEISDILRIPIKTVGSRLYRGKQLLRIEYTLAGGDHGR